MTRLNRKPFTPILPFSLTKEITLIEGPIEGGLGTVFKAVYHKLEIERPIAVKFVKRDSDESHHHLKKEASTLAQLHHPHLVSFIDIGTYEDMYFIVMEWIEGTDLRGMIESKRLQDLPPFSIQESKEFILPIIKALQYLENQNPPLIHGDLTPENIIIDRHQHVKILDLGSCRKVNEALTVIQGKHSYLDPALFKNNKVIASSDLFSLGLIFIELLTLKKVYQESLEGRICKKDHLLQSLATNFRADEIRFIEQWISENPGDRPNLKEIEAFLLSLNQIEKTVVIKTPKKSKAVRHIFIMLAIIMTSSIGLYLIKDTNREYDYRFHIESNKGQYLWTMPSRDYESVANWDGHQFESTLCSTQAQFYEEVIEPFMNKDFNLKNINPTELAQGLVISIDEQKKSMDMIRELCHEHKVLLAMDKTLRHIANSLRVRLQEESKITRADLIVTLPQKLENIYQKSFIELKSKLKQDIEDNRFILSAIKALGDEASLPSNFPYKIHLTKMTMPHEESCRFIGDLMYLENFQKSFFKKKELTPIEILFIPLETKGIIKGVKNNDQLIVSFSEIETDPILERGLCFYARDFKKLFVRYWIPSI